MSVLNQRFEKAMPYVFEHEGGYNNHVQDKGGATNWGISLRLLQALHMDFNNDGEINYLDVKSLSQEDAEQLYFDNFWKPIYDRLIYERLGIKLFDTAINMGTMQSNRLLQRCLNSLGSNIKEDGLIGQNTFKETIKYTESQILTAFCKCQEEFYLSLIDEDPHQAVFETGWLNRANWLPD